MLSKIVRTPLPLAFLLAVTLSTATAFAGDAIYTTDKTGTVVNQNIYATSTDVYLSGGPQNTNSSGLPDGTYYFQVTDPSGKTLLSTDNAVCRQLSVAGGVVSGSTGPACKHANGTFNPANEATPVQMAPFSATSNAGLEYKAWLIAQTSSTTISTTNPKVINFDQNDSKTDNFKVQTVSVAPPGSCQPSSSLSVLVSGTNVTSYVPKGNWSVTPTTGVSVVNIEGTSITPTLIPTTNTVNSCASDPITGQTVCTANNNSVYLLTGTTLGSTLTSAGAGSLNFSGGSCTNCGVAMDATHGKAVIALSLSTLGGGGGFQYLDLATSAFEPPFLSEATTGFSGTHISEDILVDPIRNLILSPNEAGNYELVNVTTTTTPAFFENAADPGAFLDSAGEDCSTGIALAGGEGSSPSSIYIADLTQAVFTAGTPGSWTAASQIQSLSESVLSAGASGLAVAQGAHHQGIVSGEFGGNGITAIQLPATSGSGTPAISDWVTCSIPGFSDGFDPHTVTAYESPNTGDAIALLANGGATSVAVVDLTQMLNPTIVSRTVAGHGCSAGTLPSTVVTFVSVP